MDRITKADLDRMVAKINHAAGTPPEPYGCDESGRHRPNARNYHLDYAYGSVKLCQMCDTGSGTRTIIDFGTKRELYEAMRVYLDGLRAGTEIREATR